MFVTKGMLPSNSILNFHLKSNSVWPYLESMVWQKPQDEQPRNQIELMLAIYDACEEMSKPGTEANEKLFNAFYGTFDDFYGERR